MIGFTSSRAWLAGSVLALATAFGCGAAHAVPVTLSIDTGTNFSLVHQGSNASGTGGSVNFLRFTPGQSIDLDLDGQLLMLFDGLPQSFTLASDGNANNPVTTGTLTVTAFSATLDSSGNGFAGGSLSYDLMSNGNIGNNNTGGDISGVFQFADQQYGNGPFNSASIVNGTLALALWGGDVANNAGIDIVGSGAVPEPGMTALLSLGLVGFVAARRRRRV